MTTFYWVAAIVLLVSIGGGAFQVMRGPTAGDRVLIMQLLGTGAVAVLLLVGKASANAAFVDVALLLALLAAITMVAFVRLSWSPNDRSDERD